MKTAVVTGASQGIGLAIAERLAEEGYDVFNFSLPNRVQDYAECAWWLAHNIDNGCDLLVNNAGVCNLTSFEAIPIEEWQQTIDVNLTGVFKMSKATIPYLKYRGGDIINIASRAAVYAHPNHSAYCASKAGVVALSEVMSMDLRKYGIRVGCILPGVVATRLAGIEPQEWFLQPSDIADAVMSMVNLPRRASFGVVHVKPSWQPFK